MSGKFLSGGHSSGRSTSSARLQVASSNVPSSHEFEWKKDECYMIRKPDPPVLVAVTSEPPSRIRNGSVQILDYNLNR